MSEVPLYGVRCLGGLLRVEECIVVGMGFRIVGERFKVWGSRG